MTDDDRIPASFVWTGDDGPDDQQRVPEGPALGNYPAYDYKPLYESMGLLQDRRTTMGEKIARFLEDLAEKVRGIH